MIARIQRALFLTALLAVAFSFSTNVFAATGTINASYKYAKLCGNADCSVYTQINFKPTLGTAVSVTDSAITGEIWSEKLGWINLNPTTSGVLNDGTGTLSGYAWGQLASWINFAPTHGGVTINSSGEFGGWAWVSGPNGGWIKFDCTDVDACVKTDWLGTGGGAGAGAGAGGGGSSTSGSGSTGNPSTNPTTNPTTNPSTNPTTNPTTNPSTNPPTDPTNPPKNPTNPPTDPSVTPPANTFTQQIVQQIASTFTETVAILGDALTGIRTIMNKPDVSVAVKVATTIGMLAGVSVSVASLLFASPFSFSEIALIPMRLWSLLLGFLGFKKRRRPWGTVYDAVTKQPIDPVVVVLRDDKGEDVSTSITDLDGRYGFLVRPGMYTIIANRTNYIFPSKKLFGKDRDELYSDLYFGGPIMVTKEGDVIGKNIPLDPIKEDWNEQTKESQHLMSFFSRKEKWLRHASDVLFAFGFSVATIALIAAPNTYNIVVFVAYLFLGMLRQFGLRHMVPLGGVMYKDSGLPLRFAIVRIFIADTNSETLHKITDKTGRFYCLIRNGRYYATIEKKKDDGSYEKIFTSLPFDVTKGYINTLFEV